MSTGTPEAHPRLVGDIGGTNARFALVAAPGERPAHVETLACADFGGPGEAIRAYLAMVGQPVPAQAAIGIANPVTGDQVAMTNHAWRFSVAELRRSLGLKRLLLINDFTALALALPHLAAHERRQVGGDLAAAGHAIALLGAGTGLGISGLVPCGPQLAPIAGEGGHVTLAAGNEREAQVIAQLRRRFGHVSAERALSGPGLEALHQALRALEHEPPAPLSAAEISRRAIERECSFCVDAVRLFCALLGSVAGDLALTLGAQGGVYIGGGIVPKLGKLFLESDFRARFEAKGRFSSYLAPIPVFVVHAPFAALDGAAHALDTPLALGIDDTDPSWQSR